MDFETGLYLSGPCACKQARDRRQSTEPERFFRNPSCGRYLAPARIAVRAQREGHHGGRRQSGAAGGLRAFSAFVILVLVVGAGLFFMPDLVKPRWPWPLAPFNARFLGSFYIAELVAMAALLVWNRWSPARMILVMAFVFTLVVTVTSAMHLDHFNFNRKNGWLWFIVYGASVLVSGWFLLRARGTPPVSAAPAAARWRGLFMVEAVILVLYGLGLLVAAGDLRRLLAVGDRRLPRAGLQRDLHHGRGRRVVAVAPCAARGAVALGAAQLVLGVLAIIGLALTDSRGQAGRLDSHRERGCGWPCSP